MSTVQTEIHQCCIQVSVYNSYTIAHGTNVAPYSGQSTPISADALFPPEQAGGQMWTSGAAPPIAPTSNPLAALLPYPQLDLFSASDPHTHQQAMSYPTNPSSTVPHGRPMSPPEPRPASGSNILTVLNTFSQLSPEERRSLLPVLGAIGAEPSASSAPLNHEMTFSERSQSTNA